MSGRQNWWSSVLRPVDEAHDSAVVDVTRRDTRAERHSHLQLMSSCPRPGSNAVVRDLRDSLGASNTLSDSMFPLLLSLTSPHQTISLLAQCVNVPQSDRSCGDLPLVAIHVLMALAEAPFETPRDLHSDLHDLKTIDLVPVLAYLTFGGIRKRLDIYLVLVVDFSIVPCARSILHYRHAAGAGSIAWRHILTTHLRLDREDGSSIGPACVVPIRGED